MVQGQLSPRACLGSNKAVGSGAVRAASCWRCDLGGRAAAQPGFPSIPPSPHISVCQETELALLPPEERRASARMSGEKEEAVCEHRGKPSTDPLRSIQLPSGVPRSRSKQPESCLGLHQKEKPQGPSALQQCMCQGCIHPFPTYPCIVLGETEAGGSQRIPEDPPAPQSLSPTSRAQRVLKKYGISILSKIRTFPTVGIIFKYRSLEFHLQRNIHKRKNLLLPLQVKLSTGEE